ncbi:MAG: hypothetical protein AAFP84_11590 [Actinomycetota bacterium]
MLAAGAFALAACGGGSDGESLPDVAASADDGVTDASDAAGESADVGDASSDGATPVGELLSTQVDLLGETVRPESEFEANLLPSVVLDDVTTGRKVNFRNLVPQDKPVLLWMYAPH